MTARVPETCVATTAEPLAFGTLDPQAGTDATATIGVACTRGLPYTVSLQGTASESGSRVMTSADGGVVYYALYSDSERTRSWGATVGVDTVAGVGDGSPRAHPVYGRIPYQTRLRVGDYSDLVIVTVTY